MQLGASFRVLVQSFVFICFMNHNAFAGWMRALGSQWEEGLSSSHVSTETIEGQVVFQKRFTKVVHKECESRPCSESQAYWSILIQTPIRSYLVNQRFQVGQTRAPAEVELGGVVLREGMWVQLEGALCSDASGLFVISDFQKVNLLSGLGWACHSLEEEGSTLFARVWRESPGTLSSGYRLRVQEVKGRKVQTLADVHLASVISEEQSLLFFGESAEPRGRTVQLLIQRQSQSSRDLPSQLRVFQSVIHGNEESLETPRSVPMSCSQTRSELILIN